MGQETETEGQSGVLYTRGACTMEFLELFLPNFLHYMLSRAPSSSQRQGEIIGLETNQCYNASKVLPESRSFTNSPESIRRTINLQSDSFSGGVVLN